MNELVLVAFLISFFLVFIATIIARFGVVALVLYLSFRYCNIQCRTFLLKNVRLLVLLVTIGVRTVDAEPN